MARGRKKKEDRDEVRSERIVIRVTPKEKETLEMLYGNMLSYAFRQFMLGIKE